MPVYRGPQVHRRGVVEIRRAHNIDAFHIDIVISQLAVMAFAAGGELKERLRALIIQELDIMLEDADLIGQFTTR